ncbi:hypothetical protein D3C86_1419470 [compost metagenome]
MLHYRTHQSRIGIEVGIRFAVIMLSNKLVYTIKAVEYKMRIHLSAQRLQTDLFIFAHNGVIGPQH